MAFTSLDDKRVNLGTVLSEICIGINERRQAIDVSLIDFVIDRDGTISQFPEPDAFGLRFYGQEFADIQQVITDEVKKVSYTSSTGGVVVYVSTIPDYTGTLSIDAAPQDTITDTLDPDQWAWYISELDKKTKVRISPSDNSTRVEGFFGSALYPVEGFAWTQAYNARQTIGPPSALSLGWGLAFSIGGTLKTIATINDSFYANYETSEYDGAFSDGRINILEITFPLSNMTEVYQMEYTIGGTTFNVPAAIGTPQSRSNFVFTTPTLGNDLNVPGTVDNVNPTTSAYDVIARLFSFSALGSTRISMGYAFFSNISGELTDQT